MGLTIHYTLAMLQPLSDAAVRHMAAQARVFAQESEAESVSRLLRVGPDFPLAHEWITLEQYSGGQIQVDVPPQDGHVCTVTLGKDSEGLLLGLCRYPSFVNHHGRQLPTRLSGWRLRYFCKTQYASLHGWEHFLRCHRTVIDLLVFWRTLGAKVRINDEGGYWPRKSVATLRRNLDEMNGIVAAMGGALKDSGGDATVESPIFQHPQFERLEAEGERKHGRRMKQAVQIIRKIAPAE